MNSEQFNETVILEEQTNEMEENENETISNIVESTESVSNSSPNGNTISNKNNKKNDNTSSSNRVKKNNSKVKNNQTPEVKKEEIPTNNKIENDSEQIVQKSKEKEEKGTTTSKSVEVIIETPEETSIEKDPTYIRMKKELFSSSSECNNKGMEINLKDMENIASTMCSSESYKGVEVGFRLYIRYKDGTYKEYKK